MRKLFSIISVIVLSSISLWSQSTTVYQWWLDNDSLNIQSGVIDSGQLKLNHDVSYLSPGLHHFNLRLINDEGVWGTPYRQSFITVDDKHGATSYEYWMDDDLDKKVSGQVSSDCISFGLDIANCRRGLHSFSFRLLNHDGEWSPIYRKTFFTTPTTSNAISYEYWIDNDYESRHKGLIVEGDNVYTVQLNGIIPGIHRFSYRMLSDNGEWGTVYTQMFYFNAGLQCTEYEYWMDNDTSHKVTGKVASNPFSFSVPLDSLKTKEYNLFSMRIKNINGEWSPVYRKMILLYGDTASAKIIGYHHALNGKDLGYVPVKNNPSGKYNFMVDLPEGEGINLSDIPLTFDGDSVSMSHTCTFDYKLRIESELGWSPANSYTFDSTVSYSADAEKVNIPSSIKFARPGRTEFKAVKFETDGRELYIRTDRKAALDIYKQGEKVTSISSDSITDTYKLTLDEGTYFGILYDVAKGDGDVILHLLDTDNQVPRPEIRFADKWVEISDRYSNAEIHYTIDDEFISKESNLYTGRFEMQHNGTIRAIAIDPNGHLNDSEIATSNIDWNTVPTPTASFANRQLTLYCADANARIHYTTETTAEKEDFSVYENPIEMTTDCTVRFYATREQFNDSEIANFSFVKAEHQEPNPVIGKDYRNRKLTVNAPNCMLEITIDGNTSAFNTPVTLDVTPDMESIRVVALAGNADRYDSDPVEEKLLFHLPPVVNYDGHTISVSIADNDPAKQDAEVKANFNGIEFTGNHQADEMGSVSATVESDKAFLSDPTELPVDFFNTGKKAGARNGHSLSEAFAGWRSETGYPQLTIVGEIDREDLEFIAGIGELTTLSLNPDRMADGSYDSALEGSGIETIYLKEAPDGLLRGMPALTSVVWVNANATLAPAAFDSPMNPNILIWTANESLVTADTRNIVTSTGIGADPSVAMTGHADSISLTPGHPYNAHNPIEVNHIEFAKQFTQPTQPEVCRGWETIALPFTPGDIRHRDKGAVVPYAVWEENNADGVIDDNGPKPFWIYRATADDWQPAASIEAGMPYIISMPNNPDYIESYNLAGEIVFGAENVRIGDSGPDNGGVRFPYVSDWVSGMSFHATFMPVEEEHLSLNSGREEAAGDYLPGSVFTSDAETLPFGAYVTGTAARFVPLFGGGNGVSLPTLSGVNGIRVEVPGQNCLRLTSPRSCRVDIHTTTGALVRSVSLPPSESVVVRDLTPGIYLVAGRKVLIR